MKRSYFSIVYRKELLDSLRDRRALVSMIAMPLMFLPLFVLIGLWAGVTTHERSRVYTISFIGGEDASGILEKIEALDSIKVVDLPSDYRSAISDRELQAVVEFPDGFVEGIDAEKKELIVTLYTFFGDNASSTAADRIEAILRDEHTEIVRRRLAENRLDSGILEPFEIEWKNVASPERVTAALMGGIAAYMLLMVSITVGIYPALDLTAGEKERGTMETLLSSSVPRYSLALGKFAVVLTFSLASLTLALLAFGGFGKGTIWFLSRGSDTGLLSNLHIDPMSLVFFIAMLVPIAALFSALSLTLSLYARSYKEAQSYVGSLVLLAMFPAVMALMPEVELTFALALIPILNVSLIGRELLGGIYDWGMIGTILFSSFFYAAIALYLVVRLFEREEVIFRE